MEIILNGKKTPLEKEMTVTEFIQNLGKEKNMNLSGAVVLIDDEVVKKADWDKSFVKAGSAIEVLAFVSGG
ncbi:sulfur carrier protein ThiS [Fusobacterium sp.]|uniref:sulfur carrier protein ThiS n=1 Tax=Fusobacterium sp. TaxID=68766 RepID=UPI002631E685|nr:sulfur carrier protein ThiS [Fusobacterium sp.]